MEKTTWYIQETNEDPDNNIQDFKDARMAEHYQRLNKGGVKSSSKYACPTSVIFVERTRGGELADMLRTEEKLFRPTWGTL